MTDIPDIPDIEIPNTDPKIPDIPSDEGLDSFSSDEQLKTPEEDLEGVEEADIIGELEEQIDKDVMGAKEAGSEYQEDLKIGADELGIPLETMDKLDEDINEINKEIEKEGSDTKEKIEDKDTNQNTQEDRNNKDEKSEEPENIDWVEEDLNKETKEFLEENGYENLTKEFTPEELIRLKQLESEILDKIKSINVGEGTNALKLLEQLPQEEKDRTKELIKILLRVAIKVATKTTAIIAKNIAKSSDDKTTKAIFGTIADVSESSGKFLNEVIAGGEEHSNLAKDLNTFFKRRNNADSNEEELEENEN